LDLIAEAELLQGFGREKSHQLCRTGEYHQGADQEMNY
jgi:hypothetical protein